MKRAVAMHSQRETTMAAVPIWLVGVASAKLHAVKRILLSHPISVVLGVLVYVAILIMALWPTELCVTAPSTNSSESATVCLYGQSYLTCALLWGSLLLMANEVPTDLVMLSFTIVLVLTNTITNTEAWSGFSSTSVLSIGALFLVARCLEETRAVEIILRPILGNPGGHRSALIRLCLPVAFLSAFLNNTPIVAMLIGVCESWAARANLSVKVLLIPLSFAAILGGMCTLIGTSTNLVLNGQIEADTNPPLKPLSMFDLTPVGAPTAAAGLLYIIIVTPLVFRDRSKKEAAPPTAPAHSDHAELSQTLRASAATPAGTPTHAHATRFGTRGSPRYTIEVLVTSSCKLLVDRPPMALAGLVNAPSCQPLLLLREGVSHTLDDTDASRELTLQPLDRLLIGGLAEDIIALRRVSGLEVRPDDGERTAVMPRGAAASLEMMEVTLAAGSSLVGLPLRRALDADGLRGTDVWAIRARCCTRMLAVAPPRACDDHAEMSTPQVEISIATTDAAHSPAELAKTYRYGPRGQVWYKESNVIFERSSPTAADRDSTDEVRESDGWRRPLRRLRAGDSLLLEAPESWVDAKSATSDFVRLKKLEPMEHTITTAADPIHEALKLGIAVALLLAMLTLSALDLVNLFPLALTVAGLLIAVGCITMDQAWRSINYRVLLTIAMAFGPGEALSDTNVSAVVGAGLTELRVLGPFGFLLCVFLATSLLSCLVSHAAAVVTFYSVLRELSIEGISAEQMMMVMICGASCTFATPLGYQTNLMVLGRGGYAFSDFFLLGGGLTIVTGCVAAACALAFVQ